MPAQIRAALGRKAQDVLRRRREQNPLKWIVPPGESMVRPFCWLPKQVEAISCGRRCRIIGYLAGNRAGKTEWAVREVFATGTGLDVATLHEMEQDPADWRLGPGKLIWCITTTFEKSRDTQQRYLWDRIPHCLMKRGTVWSEKAGFYGQVLPLINGTRYIFKTAKQPLNTYEGDAIHEAWFDEEVPLPYFTSTIKRTADFRGRILWTAWPSDPLLHDLFIKHELSPDQRDLISSNAIGAVFAGMAENPFISAEEIEFQKSLTLPEEIPGRIYGQFALVVGLVYGSFEEEKHVRHVQFPISEDWTRYEAIDPGWDNPCAVLFGAVDRRNRKWCYDEIYERHRTIGEIAAMIYAKRWEHRGVVTPAEILEFQRLTLRDAGQPTPQSPEEQPGRERDILSVVNMYRRRLGDCRPQATVIDESAKQRDQAKPVSALEQFRRFGIVARPVSNADKVGQRRAVRQLLKPLAELPRFFIAAHCEWGRWEFAHFRMARPNEESGEYLDDVERVISAHNHLMSCLEYWISEDPQWVPPEERQPEPGTILARHAEIAERRKSALADWRKRG